MKLADDFALGPAALGEVAEDGEDCADGEAEEEEVVGALAEELVRAESSPEDGRGEEGVDSRACEAPGCVGRADAVEVHLEVEDTGADES